MATTTHPQHTLFEQGELSKFASPATKGVLDALADPKWDFRTVEGISTETGVPKEEVEEILRSYPTLVRKSLVRDVRGQRLYTLKSRGMKSAEKRALLRIFVTKTP